MEKAPRSRRAPTGFGSYYDDLRGASNRQSPRLQPTPRSLPLCVAGRWCSSIGRPTLTFWLARAAEYARAGRTRAPAIAAEQVDLVVAKVQRVGVAGAGFAERRVERAEDGVPGEGHLALCFLANKPDGNRAYRQRHQIGRAH